jgi:hypothetical protein
MEEMVSIPRISEFFEVMNSTAKAFHHILKIRIGHTEQLSKEVLDSWIIKSMIVIFQVPLRKIQGLQFFKYHSII